MNRLVITGYPLGHSLSPVMQNAALLAMGLSEEYRYDLHPLPEDKLNTLVEAIRNDEIFGANITIPYKTKITKHLDAVSSQSQSVGSVNTLVQQGSKVVGINTDVIGVIEALRENDVELLGANVTILGAGGAAKAVAFALVEVGINRLDILNRTLVNAEELASAFAQRRTLLTHVGVLPQSKLSLSDSNLLVNCTPLGMVGHSPNQSPLLKSELHRDLVVMDIVYNPLRTKLLQDAEEIGCRTIDGLSMLVHQGAQSLKIWTNQKVPVEVMRNAAQQALKGIVF